LAVQILGTFSDPKGTQTRVKLTRFVVHCCLSDSLYALYTRVADRLCIIYILQYIYYYIYCALYLKLWKCGSYTRDGVYLTVNTLPDDRIFFTKLTFFIGALSRLVGLRIREWEEREFPKFLIMFLYLL